MRRTIETLRRARQTRYRLVGLLWPLVRKAASSGGDASSSSEGDGSSGPKAATSTLVAHSPIAARDCWRACRATSAGVGSGLEGEWVLRAHRRKARTMALRLVSRRTTNLPVLGMDHWARRYRDAVTTNRERGGKCRCGSVNSPSADDSHRVQFECRKSLVSQLPRWLRQSVSRVRIDDDANPPEFGAMAGLDFERLRPRWYRGLPAAKGSVRITAAPAKREPDEN